MKVVLGGVVVVVVVVVMASVEKGARLEKLNFI